jgi:RHS repeat-associated protein
MRHDEFGRVLVDTVATVVPFGFAGGMYDPDTGLVRFGARDYEPETGRSTAKDVGIQAFMRAVRSESDGSRDLASTEALRGQRWLRR